MPKHTPKTVRIDHATDTDNPCGPYEAALYSDSGGLTLRRGPDGETTERRFTTIDGKPATSPYGG